MPVFSPSAVLDTLSIGVAETVTLPGAVAMIVPLLMLACVVPRSTLTATAPAMLTLLAPPAPSLAIALLFDSVFSLGLSMPLPLAIEPWLDASAVVLIMRAELAPTV